MIKYNNYLVWMVLIYFFQNCPFITWLCNVIKGRIYYFFSHRWIVMISVVLTMWIWFMIFVVDLRILATLWWFLIQERRTPLDSLAKRGAGHVAVFFVSSVLSCPLFPGVFPACFGALGPLLLFCCLVQCWCCLVFSGLVVVCDL